MERGGEEPIPGGKGELATKGKKDLPMSERRRIRESPKVRKYPASGEKEKKTP